jgi:hypothetical protein
MLWKMDWLWPNKEKKWKLNSQHIKQPNASSHHTTTEFEPKPKTSVPVRPIAPLRQSALFTVFR